MLLSKNAPWSRRNPLLVTGATVICLLLYVINAFKPLHNLPPTPDLRAPPSIPHKIWQIFFGYSPIDQLLGAVQTWPTVNQDYQYTLMSGDGADKFVRQHYAQRPDILETFINLKFPVLRSDLLRYLILESEGGVYSDLDTTCVKPFEEWIPTNMKEEVRAVVGIEYDQGDGEPYFGMDEPIQFCQWTMATSPAHPIMQKVVLSVIQSLKQLAVKNGTTVAGLNPSDDEVITVTGPVIWSRAVMEALSEATGTLMSHKNVTGMQEPKLFGDILVLPINGFGSGQPHSQSYRGEGTAPDAMVRHMWKGSWKHGWSN